MDNNDKTGGTFFGGSPYLGGDGEGFFGGSVLGSVKAGKMWNAGVEAALIVSLVLIVVYLVVLKREMPEWLPYVAAAAAVLYGYNEWQVNKSPMLSLSA